MREGYKMTELGEVPVDWKTGNLKEFTVVTTSNVDKKINEGEHEVLLCNYMDVYRNDYITSGISFMRGSATEAEISKFLLKNGDVILTKDSETREDIGQSAVVSEDLVNVLCGYHLSLIRPIENAVNGMFLSKLLQIEAVRKQLINKANGTTRYGLNIGVIENLSILLPPLPEQQKIATILSTVDEKIEVIDAQITQTRELKKGLMQKLLTRGIGHTKFKDSVFGEIPESWEVKRVSEITLWHKQGYYTKENYQKEGVKLIRITDLRGHRVDFSEMPHLKLSDKDYCDFKVELGDFLFVRTGASIGRYGIVESLDYPSVFASYLINFRFNPDLIMNRFFGYFFESFNSVNQLKGIIQGNANVNINAENIKSLKLPLPSLLEQKEIAFTLSCIDEKLNLLQTKKETYQQLKKGLMQQLLTGKVRVMQAELQNA